SGYQTCQEYLDYCKHNKVSLETANFNGTLYELYSKQMLESFLRCKGLIRTGGAYDNGLDLYGKWDLSQFHAYSKEKLDRTEKVSSRSLVKQSIEGGAASLAISLEKDIAVLVQCKNVSRRITASLVRELAGIYNYHVKKRTGPNSVLTSYMLLISPTTMTAQALSQMNTSTFPMVHLVLPALQYTGPRGSDTVLQPQDLFDVVNWSGKGIQLAYLNSKARSLLAGLNMELQLQLVVNK
ncbi:uncharacterized protein CANTADRAFT_36098, partial [Suhomyces tanzawaensis NRRL Y-17324]